jgi:hypothetical protein
MSRRVAEKHGELTAAVRQVATMLVVVGDTQPTAAVALAGATSGRLALPAGAGIAGIASLAAAAAVAGIGLRIDALIPAFRTSGAAALAAEAGEISLTRLVAAATMLVALVGIDAVAIAERVWTTGLARAIDTDEGIGARSVVARSVAAIRLTARLAGAIAGAWRSGRREQGRHRWRRRFRRLFLLLALLLPGLRLGNRAGEPPESQRGENPPQLAAAELLGEPDGESIERQVVHGAFPTVSGVKRRQRSSPNGAASRLPRDQSSA